MRFRYLHFYSFDNDDMKSSKRHVILLSLIFLLKCFSKSFLIKLGRIVGISGNVGECGNSSCHE